MACAVSMWLLLVPFRLCHCRHTTANLIYCTNDNRSEWLLCERTPYFVTTKKIAGKKERKKTQKEFKFYVSFAELPSFIQPNSTKLHLLSEQSISFASLHSVFQLNLPGFCRAVRSDVTRRLVYILLFILRLILNFSMRFNVQL